MKKISAFILSIAVFLSLVFPLIATASAADIPADLPQDIQKYFSAKSYADCKVLGHAALTNHGNNDCCFVLLRDGKGINTLFCFKQKKNTWKKEFQTSKAVPQTNQEMWISIAMEGGYEAASPDPIKAPQLCIGMMNDSQEYVALWTIFSLEKGQWNLHSIYGYSSGYEAMVVKENSITYYHDAEFTSVKGTVRGSIQRDIRYLNLSSVPKTYEKAKATLTEAPTLPRSDKLFAQEVKFKGGKKYAVYSAPDKKSLRGANGKAAVSTNGWIQVFGEEDGFILVQYSIDAKHYRFGYIDAASLPKGTDIDPFFWDSRAAWTNSNVSVTDDPLFSAQSLTTLPDHAPVTLLATLGDWAYIESSTGDLLRGFVPLSCLDTTREIDLSAHSFVGNAPMYQGTMSVSADGQCTVSLSIPAGSTLANRPITAIVLSNPQTGETIGTLTLNPSGEWEGTCNVAGTTSVRFTAVESDGQNTLPYIDIEW